jgi:hypothetical protein
MLVYSTESTTWRFCSSSAWFLATSMYQLLILDSVVDGRCCGYSTVETGPHPLRFHAAVTILTCSLRQEQSYACQPEFEK